MPLQPARRLPPIRSLPGRDSCGVGSRRRISRTAASAHPLPSGTPSGVRGVLRRLPGVSAALHPRLLSGTPFGVHPVGDPVLGNNHNTPPIPSPHCETPSARDPVTHPHPGGVRPETPEGSWIIAGGRSNAQTSGNRPTNHRAPEGCQNRDLTKPHKTRHTQTLTLCRETTTKPRQPHAHSLHPPTQLPHPPEI